jgi:hypothetical protein
VHVLRGGADDLNFGPDITGMQVPKHVQVRGQRATTPAVRDDPDSLLTGAGILTRALQNGLLTGTRRGSLAEEVLPSSQGRRRTPCDGHRRDSPSARRHGRTRLRTGPNAAMYSRAWLTRFVVVTTSSVNRLTVSEALPEVAKYLNAL